MSDSEDSQDSPNVKPQSLRPAGHDVSTSYTGNQEDHHQVGEPSNRDALRQEVTTEPEKLSPENAHDHQTRGRGAPFPWHLGPRDRPVLDEGLETSRSLVQAEGWNRLTDYRSHWNSGNVAVPEDLAIPIGPIQTVSGKIKALPIRYGQLQEDMCMNMTFSMKTILNLMTHRTILN